MENYNIDDLVGRIDFSSGKYNDIGKGILLTNKEIEVLDRYNIPYKKCNSLKDIIFEVEEVIADMDIVDEELDDVSDVFHNLEID